MLYISETHLCSILDRYSTLCTWFGQGQVIMDKWVFLLQLSQRHWQLKFSKLELRNLAECCKTINAKTYGTRKSCKTNLLKLAKVHALGNCEALWNYNLHIPIAKCWEGCIYCPCPHAPPCQPHTEERSELRSGSPLQSKPPAASQ